MDNLNISTRDFLSAFFKADETIYLRSFDDRGLIKNSGENEDCTLKAFHEKELTLREKNEQKRGIFFVPNGGGQTDEAVKAAKIARAQFIDIDDCPIPEQWERINAFALPPSIVVQTKKSLHAYWLLENGDIAKFRGLQNRLNEHFGADVQIKNESRVMRLPGFYHQKTDNPVMVQVMKFDPDLRYTQEQLSAALPELPKKTRAKKTADTPTTKIAVLTPEGKITVGNRNSALFNTACHLARCKKSAEEILGELEQKNNLCEEPLPLQELETIAASALKYADNENPSWIIGKFNPLTGEIKKVVSAPLLYQFIKHNTHYFFVRDESRGAVMRYWYVDGYYKAVGDYEIKGEIKNFIEAYDILLVQNSIITEVFNLLVNDTVFISSDKLNANENIINFCNGILHLGTMELTPHSPEHFCTIQISCDWTGAESATPVFDSFLAQLTEEDSAKQTLLLQFMGAALSNVYGWRMKKALFMVGKGNTGKSQLKSLTERLLGQGNFASVDLRELESRFGTSQIYNKRLSGSADMSFMSVNELKTLKTVTGGDYIFGEFKGQSGFSFRYNGLLWFCTNELPRFSGDNGQWVYDRLLVVTCNNVVPEEKQDKTLQDKMFAEREGIVYKAVKALQTVINNNYKFTTTTKLRGEVENWQSENNTTYAFYKECCQPREVTQFGTFDTRDKVTCKILYDFYCAWCKDNNNKHAETKKKFAAALYSVMGITEESGKKRMTDNLYFAATITPEAYADYAKIIPFHNDFLQSENLSPF